jgi:hypothetical protein
VEPVVVPVVAVGMQIRRNILWITTLKMEGSGIVVI